MWDRREEVAATAGLPPATVAHLLRRHGALATEVFDLVADRPELAEPLHPGVPYLAAEIVHAAAQEDARHLGDALLRRTRVALETRDGGRSVARAAALLMAPVLGWDDSDVGHEVEVFLQGGAG
jgi:glycerol-3-phosphate dehydrogenase